MSAAAQFSSEFDDESVDSHLDSSPSADAPSAVDVQDAITVDSASEWGHYTPYVEQFGGSEEVAIARKIRRRGRRRHRPLRVTSLGVATALVVMELIGMVGLQASQAKAARFSSQLDDTIKTTEEDISSTDSKISLLQAPLALNQWAAQLGYHQAGITDYDDITKDTPLPAPSPAPGKSAGGTQ